MGLSPIWLTKRGGMELRQLRTNTKRKFPSSRLPLRTRSRCRQHTNALGRPIGEKNMQRAGGKQLLSIACDSQLRKGSVSEKEGRRKGGRDHMVFSQNRSFKAIGRSNSYGS